MYDQRNLVETSIVMAKSAVEGSEPEMPVFYKDIIPTIVFIPVSQLDYIRLRNAPVPDCQKASQS